MLDKIMIVNKHSAMMIFTNREPFMLTSDRDVREMLYWWFDFHRNIANDDITEKIYIEDLEKAS